MRVLVVEDDPELGRQLTEQLGREGYAVDRARDGEEGEFMGATEPYDAVVLDLGLPRLDGLSVLRRWRAAGNAVPVLILTARDAWQEKVQGIDAGADDYLAKPFRVEELLARLRALIRRAKGQASAELRCGGGGLHTPPRGVPAAGGAGQGSGERRAALRRGGTRHPHRARHGRGSAGPAHRPRVPGPGLPDAPPGPGGLARRADRARLRPGRKLSTIQHTARDPPGSSR